MICMVQRHLTCPKRPYIREMSNHLLNQRINSQHPKNSQVNNPLIQTMMLPCSKSWPFFNKMGTVTTNPWQKNAPKTIRIPIPNPIDQVQELIIDYPREMVQETGWREKPSVDTPPRAEPRAVKRQKKRRQLLRYFQWEGNFASRRGLGFNSGGGKFCCCLVKEMRAFKVWQGCPTRPQASQRKKIKNVHNVGRLHKGRSFFYLEK